MNKEQQKAARKEAAKYDPVYHGGLRRDVKFMLGVGLPFNFAISTSIFITVYISRPFYPPKNVCRSGNTL